MGKKSRKKCSGGICLINPLGVLSECYVCPHYGGKPPPVMRSMPGHEDFTAEDEPPSEDAHDKHCAYCGTLFWAASNKLYCCRSCSKKAYRQRRAERGNTNRRFAPQTCVICGRTFYPRTDRQQTCGGKCTKVFLAKKYGWGVPKNHPPVVADQGMETYANCPVQRMKECVVQIKRHNPNATVSPSSLESLAAVIRKRLPWFSGLARPRQAVLLDIAIFYGVHALFSMDKFITAFRSGKYEHARQALLNSRYASLHGKWAVENARQIATGQWTVIPAYIPPSDDDDDEEGEDSEDEDDGVRFF